MRHYINITQYLDATAANFPQKTAVVDGKRSMTFADVQAAAINLAASIEKSLNGCVRQVIGVFLPKSLEALIADLAILYSGNIYMNLDVKNPVSRLEAIIDKTSPVLLVIKEGTVPPQLSVPILLIDVEKLEPLPQAEFEHVLAIRSSLMDADLCCLINTSGSTGTPKAVALTHRGFINFTEAVRNTGLVTDDEIVGSLSPVIFDIWSFEICMLMAFSSCIFILKESDAAFPVRLLEKIQKGNVSFIFWVPTIMVNIATTRALDVFPLPTLRMVWFAGEVFPTPKFNYWRQCLPCATFANFYGPIEITIDCLYHVIKEPLHDDQPIPIGRPFSNTRVFLLDEDGCEITQVTHGVNGEICVAGSSLAAGYYNDPEKTAAAFTINPLQTAWPEVIYRTGDIGRYNQYGEILFAGRKDTLIKHHGYRIELGEIEHMAPGANPALSNCCALYDGQRIVLVYESAQKLDEKQLMRDLSRIMPRYMIPQSFWHLTEMPRNANGKIDRHFLNKSWRESNGFLEQDF